MKGRSPVRIGVVGTGIGALHIAGIASMPEVARLAAICSLELDTARALGERYGAGYVTDRYEDLLSDPDIDVIDLCTPPKEHLPMAVAAACARKHILVEKPLARNLDEADAILRTARTAGVKLMTSHNQRYFGHHAKAKALLDAGVIGQPFLVVATVHVHGHIQGFRRFLDPAGGGTLIDSGVHRFDLLRWLMGDVELVFAQTGRFMQMQMEGEDCAVVTLRFKSGALGAFSCSWSAKGPRPEESLQIFGLKGAIITEDHTRSLRLRTEDPPPGLAPVTEFYFDVDQQESMRRAIEAFARSILEGTEVPISGEDGRASLELAMASYRAQATGLPVRLPL
mgnify:CR=1 FL=1